MILYSNLQIGIDLFSTLMVILAITGLFMYTTTKFPTKIKEKEIMFSRANPNSDPESPLNSGKIVL